MLWIDLKYARLIGNELEQFKEVSNSPYIAKYRCFVCGDSNKKKQKARGYLLEKDNTIMSYCHNCGAHFTMSNFLKEKSPQLFGEYRLECMREKSNKRIVIEKPLFFTDTHFKPHSLDLGPSLNQCDDLVRQYAEKRKIPQKFYSSLYTSLNILNITKQIKKYETLKINPEPALIIPFFNKEREFSHICCRSIYTDSMFRYYVFDIDSKHPNLWGLEFIDWNKPINVFEGPIDAMCIPNSLAMGGSAGSKSLSYIIDHINNTKDVCFVYDNEIFKNKQILKQVKSKIKQNFSVVIYDKQFTGKDANEVITNEIMTTDELISYYKSRTFSGLAATLELSHQSKFKFL